MVARFDAQDVKIESIRAEMVVHRWLFGLLFAMQSAQLALILKLMYP